MRDHDPTDAVTRVTAVLATLGENEVDTAVIDAPGTLFYVQFVVLPDGLRGEAVGERYLAGASGSEARQHALTRLGWTPPSDADEDAGNWTRRWPTGGWDAADLARLVVETFVDGFGVDPSRLAIDTFASVEADER